MIIFLSNLMYISSFINIYRKNDFAEISINLARYRSENNYAKLVSNNYAKLVTNLNMDDTN